MEKVSTKLKQIFKYGLSASVGLLVDFSLVVFCVEILNFYYLVGVCIGFIVGLFITFILSNRFVFGEPKTSKKSLFIYFGIIGLIGLAILNLIVWFFTDLIGINYIFSKIIATIAVFIWNFFARKSLYKD